MGGCGVCVGGCVGGVWGGRVGVGVCVGGGWKGSGEYFVEWRCFKNTIYRSYHCLTAMGFASKYKIQIYSTYWLPI